MNIGEYFYLDERVDAYATFIVRYKKNNSIKYVGDIHGMPKHIKQSKVKGWDVHDNGLTVNVLI